MKETTVQVFLVGDQTPEVSGRLTAWEVAKGCLIVTSAEDSFKVRHVIPLGQVRMMRIYE